MTNLESVKISKPQKFVAWQLAVVVAKQLIILLLILIFEVCLRFHLMLLSIQPINPDHDPIFLTLVVSKFFDALFMPTIAQTTYLGCNRRNVLTFWKTLEVCQFHSEEFENIGFEKNPNYSDWLFTKYLGILTCQKWIAMKKRFLAAILTMEPEELVKNGVTRERFLKDGLLMEKDHVFWVYQEMSFLHSFIDRSNGLPFVWYINFKNLEEPPKFCVSSKER
ncbi:unnamed protein product [Caenorhabditis nigoni]